MIEELYAYQFHPVLQRWVEAPQVSTDLSRSALTCVTYNVWFSSHYDIERWTALLEVVRACDADIIAFQETTPAFLSLALQEAWIQKHYYLSDVTGRTIDPYGLLLLSRFAPQSLQLYSLPSLMDRKLLRANFVINDRTTTIGTVHLESTRRSAPLRAAQLAQVFPVLDAADHTILLGDFNFCASWAEENQHIDEQYQDVWASLRPDEAGYTEDTAINTMRLEHHGKEKQVRFDRVLLRSSPPGWQAQTIALLGTKPIAPDLPNIFPSDHFGLVTTLAWTDSPTSQTDTKSHTPFVTAYWVEPQRLLAGSHPRAVPKLGLEQSLLQLLASGITVFIDLTEASETASYGDILKDLARRAGQSVDYWRLSIPDEGIPTRRQMKVLLDVMDRAMTAGQKVYVHCSAGIGRTGVVVGCYLRRHGMEAEAVLRAIMDLRRGMIDGHLPSPRTSPQYQFVREWDEGG